MWKAPEKNGSEVRGCASDERIVPLNENDCQPLMKKEPAAADARRTPRILCHSAAQGASTAAAAAPGDGRKGTALSVATAASAAEVRVEMPAPMLDPLDSGSAASMVAMLERAKHDVLNTWSNASTAVAAANTANHHKM